MLRRLPAILIVFALVLAACSPPPAATLDVTALVPADGATDVAVDVVLAATFNRALDEDTLVGAIALTGPDGPVTGAIAYDAVTRTATFTPAADLDYATTYTATIDGSVAMPNGIELGTDAEWTFTTVADPAIEDAIGGITVTPATATLLVGGTVQLDAELTGIVGTPDLGITWTSGNEAVATVDADGLVTGVAEGATVITATSDFDDGLFDTAAVTVTEFAIGGYAITGPDAPLAVAGTAQLTATPFGVVGTPDTSVTWASDDEDVATIDATTGEVTAVAPGTAMMTATSVVDPSVTATFDVEVATLLEPVGIVDVGVVVGYVLDIDADTTLTPALPAPFTGGVAPYTYAVVTPADAPFALQGVPPGMTIDPTTGALSGTPTIARFYNFAVEATDAIGQTAIAYGEVEVFLVLEYAFDTYAYVFGTAPATIVPAADVSVAGNDLLGALTYSLQLVGTTPVGGSIDDWSIDSDGSITYDVSTFPYVWTIQVTVVDGATGASATFVLTFDPGI